jgi:hypothetical protein
VLEQERNCEYLMNLANEQHLRLVIPEAAFAEAEGTMVEIIQNRLNTLEPAIQALRQFSRSAYHNLENLLMELEQFISLVSSTEIPVLQTRMNEIRKVVDIVPFTAEAFMNAELRELKRIAPFKQNDRRIYESIIYFAKTNQNKNVTMLFLTRDKDDFDFSYIRDELNTIGVELFFSAGECNRRIRQVLGL